MVTITVYGDYSGAYATGIILSEDGYILTNQHVVALQSHAQVTTADNQVYDALLVGEDPNSDLALLKVEAQGLTPAEFGTSDELLVGDECFAIGNPLGINYRGSFSSGIVSALNRNVNMNDYTMTLIPVSYTHLDVYKRQVVSTWMKGKGQWPKNAFFASQSSTVESLPMLQSIPSLPSFLYASRKM